MAYLRPLRWWDADSLTGLDDVSARDLATLALAIDLDGDTFVVRRLVQRLERGEIDISTAARLLISARYADPERVIHDH
jgi:hypothetical protein